MHGPYRLLLGRVRVYRALVGRSGGPGGGAAAALAVLDRGRRGRASDSCGAQAQRRPSPRFRVRFTQLGPSSGCSSSSATRRGVGLTAEAGEAFLTEARIAVMGTTTPNTARPSTIAVGLRVDRFRVLRGCRRDSTVLGLLEASRGASEVEPASGSSVSFPLDSCMARGMDVAVLPHAAPGSRRVVPAAHHEPRVVLTPSRHPLAGRSFVTGRGVLGQETVGLRPTPSRPGRASGASMTTRGGSGTASLPTARATPRRCSLPRSSRRAITTVPARSRQCSATRPDRSHRHPHSRRRALGSSRLSARKGSHNPNVSVSVFLQPKRCGQASLEEGPRHSRRVA